MIESGQASAVSLQLAGTKLASLFDLIAEFYDSVMLTIKYIDERSGFLENSLLLNELIYGDAGKEIVENVNRLTTIFQDLVEGDIEAAESILGFVERFFRNSQIGQIITPLENSMSEAVQTLINFVDNVINTVNGSARRRRRSLDEQENDQIENVPWVEAFTNIYAELTTDLIAVIQKTAIQLDQFGSSKFLKGSKLRDISYEISVSWDPAVDHNLIEGSLADSIMKFSMRVDLKMVRKRFFHQQKHRYNLF